MGKEGNQMKKRVLGALAGAGMLLCSIAVAQEGDSRILAARDAIRNGERSTLEHLAAIHDGHVLDPYVGYWYLSSRLARSGEAPPVVELNAFLAREAGTQLGERLRADWLQRLAKDGNWAGYLALYPGLRSPSAELRCHAWTARVMEGGRVVLIEVAGRWHELADAPPACDPALQTAAAHGLVASDAIWWRIRRQVEGRQPARALSTLGWLPSAEAADPAALDQAIRSPAPYLDRLPANFAVSRDGREFALVALVRLAREDPLAAHMRLLRLQDRLDRDDRGYAYAALGFFGALEQLPQAHAWFDAAGDTPLTPRQREWRVRAALRALDWPGVRAAIEAMPADERAAPEWSYWLGRALAAGGRRTEADAVFGQIADRADFYGILAAEELGRGFVPPSPNAAIDDDSLRRARTDPGLQRALALLALDMRTEAVREWNWALHGRDDGFLLAAASLALQHGLYDRAISSAERAEGDGNFALRYLTPYRELIEPQAVSQGLDMGWVYGILRQESRFIAPARSSAGAQGLMQVMPATGKWVARKIGLAGYHAGRLSDPRTNVLLGTSYMRLILEDLDYHPVLASAGYNAGPARARRWRDEKPLEGAIYAETIPFDETRDYVKKVMANAVIYAAMLERRPQSLKARLGTVAPRPAGE
jgi:soluble lytic murein transglycosylase